LNRAYANVKLTIPKRMYWVVGR